MAKDERKDRYIQFPLCLLMETYKDPGAGFNLIVRFGIVNYAKSFKYSIEEVGKQLMYCYYREKNILPDSLLKQMQRYIDSDKLTIDEDYYGFTSGSFEPLDYTTELLGLFESDQEFKESAILTYQIRQAVSKKNLNISIGNINSVISDYERGNRIRQEFESKFGADVMPGIKSKMLFEFRDSDKDLDLFRAFVAIKSIIGRNTFATTNKPAILSRMIGCKSKAAFEYYTTDKKNRNKAILPTVEKYGKKYHMDKLLIQLMERKFIMCLSKKEVSVMYVSAYMEPKELSKIIIEAKTTKNLKQQIKDATASL